MTGSLQSQVELNFRLDESMRRTILSRRKTGGLCHLSKPYWDGSVLSVQLVNPTAGLFSGDRLEIDIDVGAGSQVALTSPSATRFHTMPEGRAEIRQTFHVGDEAWLDYWPEITIPQRDSDTKQTTCIHLTESSHMVFLDTVAPGRIAHGENFFFRRFETVFEIYEDGQLQVKERNCLEPAKGIWPLEVPGWETCYYAAIWIAGPPLSCLESLEDSFCGFSQLNDRLGVLRILAPSSLELRKRIYSFRDLLGIQIPLLTTDFRKL